MSEKQITDNPSEIFLRSAKSGELVALKECMEKYGIQINYQNESTFTALMLASYNNHTNIVKFLIQNGADTELKDCCGTTALIGAAYYGNYDIVNTLLEFGADINCKDNDGETALFHAVREGHRVLVDLLCSNGAIVDYTNIHGDSPYTVAKYRDYRDYSDIYQVLLSYGAKDEGIRSYEEEIMDLFYRDCELANEVKLGKGKR